MAAEGAGGGGSDGGGCGGGRGGGGGGGNEMAGTSPKNRVKLLCSHGGKILPRATDGVLKYVGGETRVVAFSRDINFSGDFSFSFSKRCVLMGKHLCASIFNNIV